MRKSQSKRPDILICNDDGIDAPGIFALAQEIKKIGNVIVIAPDKQQSAVGHAITMNFPLRVTQFHKNGAFFGYAVEGTPADAIKLGIRSLLKRTPTLLISGINHGSNTAINIIYSGTVSAATEGTILGIPSIAVSLTTYGEPNFKYAAKFTRKLAKVVQEYGLPPDTLLNVNVPNVDEKEIRGVLLTRQGKSRWDDTFEVRRDPSRKEYYWLTGKLEVLDTAIDTDQRAIMNNYVSITPIKYDLTDYTMLQKMESWKVNRLLRK